MFLDSPKKERDEDTFDEIMLFPWEDIRIVRYHERM